MLFRGRDSSPLRRSVSALPLADLIGPLQAYVVREIAARCSIIFQIGESVMNRRSLFTAIAGVVGLAFVGTAVQAAGKVRTLVRSLVVLVRRSARTARSAARRTSPSAPRNARRATISAWPAPRSVKRARRWPTTRASCAKRCAMTARKCARSRTRNAARCVRETCRKCAKTCKSARS